MDDISRYETWNARYGEIIQHNSHENLYEPLENCTSHREKCRTIIVDGDTEIAFDSNK